MFFSKMFHHILLQKKVLLDDFQRNYLRIALIARLTDSTSDSKLCKKKLSIPAFRGYVEMVMTYSADEGREIAKYRPFGQPLKVKRIADLPGLRCEEVVRKDLSDIRSPREVFFEAAVSQPRQQ